MVVCCRWPCYQQPGCTALTSVYCVSMSLCDVRQHNTGGSNLYLTSDTSVWTERSIKRNRWSPFYQPAVSHLTSIVYCKEIDFVAQSNMYTSHILALLFASTALAAQDPTASEFPSITITAARPPVQATAASRTVIITQTLTVWPSPVPDPTPTAGVSFPVPHKSLDISPYFSDQEKQVKKECSCRIGIRLQRRRLVRHLRTLAAPCRRHSR